MNNCYGADEGKVMLGRLPTELKYYTASDLIRVGKDYDGGYLISRSDFDETEVVLGFGMNDDWSFEQQFSKEKSISINIFDRSVSLKYFYKNALKSLIRFDHPEYFYHWIKVIVNYFLFFRQKQNSHIRKYIGKKTESGNYIDLKSIMDNITSEKIFLKVDIEGSEYRILNSIKEYEKRLTGIAIEFHDCDIHINKIISFVNDLNMKLVHIHVNTHSEIISETGIPTTLELTFSKGAECHEYCELPHKLDMPNNKNHVEIRLTFE